MRTFNRLVFPDKNEIGVTLDANLVDMRIPVFRAYLKVEGDSKHRALWREEFRRWCTESDVVATPRKGGARTYGATEFDVFLSEWRPITAFILRWIGTNWIVDLFTDPVVAEKNLKSEISLLNWRIQELKKSIDEILSTPIVNKQGVR